MMWEIQWAMQDDAIRAARVHVAFIPVTGLKQPAQQVLGSNGRRPSRARNPAGAPARAPFSLATITSKVGCSYGKIFSPLTEIPDGKTEISGTEPARKGSRGKARLI